MVDLHLTADVASPGERAAVDAAIGPDGAVVVHESERSIVAGRTRRQSHRHRLLPALHALQAEAGWINPGGLNHVADRLQIPPAEVFGVASFYGLFRTDDPGHSGSVTHVCVDPACQIAGASDLADELERAGSAVHRGPCLGQCERAPARFVQGRGEPDHVPADDAVPFRLPRPGQPHRRLTARLGVVDPTSLDSYCEHGGYDALTTAIAMGPDAVIEAVTAAGLWGRGGAAFPTGVKWRAVAAQPGPDKHVVANADESEPGTFKDRLLTEHDPFALLESLTIAGLATGAERGWIYIRGEYPLATSRLRQAIDQARAVGWLGADVGASGRSFDVELRRGAGAYICGEETALFNSIEGFRGEPRNKPPYPTTSGLFGRPTVVNNPETLVNVLPIISAGPVAYRSLGTDDSPGTKLFCLSGSLRRPGLYEVPFGTTLRALLLAAGTEIDRLRAVLLGGSAGTFVGPESLDLPLTLEDARAAGATLGSGAVMPFDDRVDLAAVVTRIAEFFRHESCGQCVPCRVGTTRQHEVLLQLRPGRPLADDRRQLLDDMARVMQDASICGLGHTAAGAVRSALDLGIIGEST